MGGKLGPKIPFIEQDGYENGGDNDEDDYLLDKQYPQDINKNGALLLIEHDGKCPKVRKEVPLRGSKKNMIAFSPNGDHLVVFRRRIFKLDIYRVDDTDSLFDIMDKIDNEETPLVSFS